MALLLLSSLAFAASPLDVARAIGIIVREGEALPPQPITRTFGEGQTAVTVSTTMHGWGIGLNGCGGYTEAGLVYGTVLEGNVLFIAALAHISTPRGDVITLDGEVDDVLDPPSLYDRISRQTLYDTLITCLLHPELRKNDREIRRVPRPDPYWPKLEPTSSPFFL